MELGSDERGVPRAGGSTTAVPDGDAADPAALAAAVLDEEARRLASTGPGVGGAVSDRPLPGVGGDVLPLADVLRLGGRPLLGVLAALVFVDDLTTGAFAVLGPDIRRALGLSELAIGVVAALGGLVGFAAAIPLGYVGDRVRRTTVVGACSLAGAVCAVAVGAAQSAWQIVLARGAAGLGKANELPLHGSLLADGYPIEGRNRVYALHRAAKPAALVLGPAVAGAVTAATGSDTGWRWTFTVLAVPAALLAIAAFRVREPRRGRNEMRAVIGTELEEAPDELRIPLGAALASVKRIRTSRYLVCALAALGLASISAPIYFNLFLDEHHHLGAGGRGVVGAVGALGGVVGALVGGAAGERAYRQSPELVVVRSAALVAASGLLVPVSLFMPNVPLCAVTSALGAAAVFAAFVPISALVAAVTPYRVRAMGFATAGVHLSLVGGLGGALLVGAIASSLGERAALTIVTPPAALAGGALLALGARHVRRDVALAAGEVVDEQAERERVAAGADVPMLQVRGLDFSYGQVQVLFDVDLDVRRGEVLALLGTNGAGKSTLLRAISGLGVADRGTVRLDGRTVTFAEPGTRLRLGVVQVPGGNAVFRTLSVRDNLLAGAYTYIWDQRRVARRVDDVVTLFPVLASKLDDPAGTLSGGEQQMLGLAMGLLLDPKVLLVDELSLGLAPVVVQQLLGVVEQLKAKGMTMVIVEQSVNVALALADRAVFMERGRVRFEGRAADLLERDDLVRAVFLGGEGG